MTDREKAIRYFQQSVDSAPIVRLSAIKEHVDACETALAALRAEEEREKGCEYCTGDFEPACDDCPPPWPDARCSACERLKKYSLQRRIREEDAFCRKCGHKLDGGGQDARKGSTHEI